MEKKKKVCLVKPRLLFSRYSQAFFLLLLLYLPISGQFKFSLSLGGRGVTTQDDSPEFSEIIKNKIQTQPNKLQRKCMQFG